MLENQPQKRRTFLIQLGAAGTAAMLSSAGGTISLLAGGETSLDQITVNSFSDLLGHSLGLRHPEDALDTAATLIEVRARTRKGDYPQDLENHRNPFSIVFRVPDWFERTQGTYVLAHPALGRLEFSMEPVDLPQNSLLEAVFG